MACLSRASVLAIVAIALLLAAPRTAEAQLQPVSGRVTGTNGAPIAGAVVTVAGNGTKRAARTGRDGRFDLGALPGGIYTLAASARGFSGVSGLEIAVLVDEPTVVTLALPPLNASSLLTIAQVTANGTPAISTAPAPSANIDARVYAGQAVTRVSDVLESALSTTVYPIIGGGLNAPAIVALRGPDPSETLVDVDGHQVNNGNTGDFDLSLLDPADLESVQVLYGIAPSALYGPNTLGGALNVVTLEPSPNAHSLERVSYGSFGTFAATLQATRTGGNLGYAFSFHRYTSAGQLEDAPFPNTEQTPSVTPCTAPACPVGNDMAAESSIGKLRYAFGDGGFVDLTYHDQAVYRDLSATLSSIGPPSSGTGGAPTYSNFSGSSIESNDDAYGLDANVPLGPLNGGEAAPSDLLFRHQTSLVSQIVSGGAAGSSPYLYNDRDLITDDTLELDRALPHASFSVKAAVTDESLVTDNILGVIYADAHDENPWTAQDELVAPQDSVTTGDPLATIQHLGQTQRWIGALYTDDPTTHLHYSLASYYSDYSSFGHSVDPRFGFVWTPSADAALRFSVGSTFQSPQLPTFIVPGPSQPIPVVGGYASIGNPNATAERSTEYDLGYERVLRLAGSQGHASLDLYRTDLHDGVAAFYGPTQCTATTVTLDEIDAGTAPDCLTYPVNVTREVYQGVEARLSFSLAAKTTIDAGYDVDSAYIESFPPSASDGAIPYEQALGVPLHKATLALEQALSPQFSCYAGVLYEGRFNELNLPPYATLRAGVTWQAHHYELTLAGENLTDAYDFLYTRAGGGIPYGAVPAPLATDAYPLPGRRITLVLTRRT